MKEYSRVRLMVEKEEYAKAGVHKGMDGWICDSVCESKYVYVCFDQDGPLPNIADIIVRKEDLEVMIE